MCRPYLVIVLASTLGLFACAGGPSAPMPPADPFAGIWRGQLSVSRDGAPATVGTSAWTFRLIVGGTYTIAIETTTDGFPAAFQGTATIFAGDLLAHGSYTDATGCTTLWSSHGLADASAIRGSFHGVHCNSVPFDGVIDLAK